MYVQRKMSSGKLIDLKIPENICGREVSDSIDSDTINDVLNHRMIGSTVVNIYIRYLYEKVILPRGLINDFSFLAPHLLHNDHEGKYIKETLLKGKNDKLTLAPYNLNHWVLLVINANADTIYYLDSLHGDITNYPDMVLKFELAFTMYHTYAGVKMTKSKLNKVTWTKIQCPRQTNGIDWGYYVMRFMKEVIMSNKKNIPENYFPDYKCSSYSKDELTEVKED